MRSHTYPSYTLCPSQTPSTDSSHFKLNGEMIQEENMKKEKSNGKIVVSNIAKKVLTWEQKIFGCEFVCHIACIFSLEFEKGV